MQLFDPTILNAFFGLVALMAAAGLVLLVASVAGGLSLTRRDRLARHESIPAYYGRLHFAR